MKVQALRGVCIGVDRHLVPGQIADVEPPLAAFLRDIGAVTNAVDADTMEQPTAPKTPPAKVGKKEH